MQPVPTIDLEEFGHTVQMTGVIFESPELGPILVPYPAESICEGKVFHTAKWDSELWEIVLKQLDEQMVVASPKDPLKKAILRKSQRQIDSKISWEVFRRDGYRCRYCWRDDVPLTVDHLVLWEHNGPSIPDNLVSACKKCNRKRGSMEYADWLRSEAFEKIRNQRRDHTNKIYGSPEGVGELPKPEVLDTIPRLKHKRSR